MCEVKQEDIKNKYKLQTKIAAFINYQQFYLIINNKYS